MFVRRLLFSGITAKPAEVDSQGRFAVAREIPLTRVYSRIHALHARRAWRILRGGERAALIDSRVSPARKYRSLKPAVEGERVRTVG